MSRTARRSRAAAHRQRLAVIAAVVVASYGALVARAIQLQALDADGLAQRAERQRSRTIELGPLRGEIHDREGTLLAASAEVPSVAASPRSIVERPETARRLGSALGMPADRIEAKLDPSRGFAWIKRWVTPDEADRVRGLELPGIRLQRERKRFYPSRTLAASYLGFAGRDGQGLSGLELAFDEMLRGTSTELSMLRDGVGAPLLSQSMDPATRRGATLVLALDAGLQHQAEMVLNRALVEFDARHATLIALDPRTGDLLAVAEAPGFDPNRFWEMDPRTYRTRGLVDAFEPGSTLKPFTVALALEEGVVSPGQEFDCENGSWRLRDRIIRDWKAHGVLSVHDIVRLSSNIGAAKIAEQLGSRRLVDGLRLWGFGERTGSQFPGETPGVLHDLAERQEVERANLAFGQGLMVTAGQLALAGAALANKGQRVVPRPALRLESGSESVEFPPRRGPRVVSRQTARTVMRMMQDVVTDGTGRAAALTHHRVAGKTGTGQKVVDGRYSDTYYVASFLGIVPADEPRLVIAVVVDEPRFGRHTGGAVAAPIFREVAGFALRQLAIPHEETG
jgi:cell division protein FtsI (penicillin-binding protein 3)